jgi:HEAT repeat protein
MAALGDEHASVRLAATEALGRIGDRGAVEHLVGVLGSGSRAVEIRKAAADSLGQIGDSRAVDSLLVCLKDASWSVRRAAAEALGWIGDPRAVEPGRVPTLGVTAAVRP